MFDIIGDVHGCFTEFKQLTKKLGYSWKTGMPTHPERQLIFLGDLTDRGPESVKVMDVTCKLVDAGAALYIPGNHCDKLFRYLKGNPVQVKHGLETTVAELKELPAVRREDVSQSFMNLYKKAPLYLSVDDDQLIIAHAGIKKTLIGKRGNAVKSFVLYGDTTGETTSGGFPIRRDWAKEYDGDAWIVYGHTPVKKPRWVGRTVNIDTGCVFGGELTALRYPEMTTDSVPSTLPYIEEKFNRV